jgi:hypothetical protein
VFGVVPLEIGASVAVEPCVGRGILGQNFEDVAAFLGAFGVPSLDLDAALLPTVLWGLSHVYIVVLDDVSLTVAWVLWDALLLLAATVEVTLEGKAYVLPPFLVMLLRRNFVNIWLLHWKAQ